MARNPVLLTLALLLPALPVAAQEPSPSPAGTERPPGIAPARPPGPPPEEGMDGAPPRFPGPHQRRPGPREREGMEGERMRRPPLHEPEERFKRNLERWKNLPPEEQARMREMFEERRRRMFADAEEAMRQIGLDPSDPRRPEFIRRYAEERRQIEEEIRIQIEAERARKLPALIEKLRGEFAPGAPAPSPGNAPRNAPLPKETPQE